MFFKEKWDKILINSFDKIKESVKENVIYKGFDCFFHFDIYLALWYNIANQNGKRNF